MAFSRTVEAGTPWLVHETTRLDELIIKEGAVITAPEGKYLTLSVNGCGRALVPGRYHGNVVVSVAEWYDMRPHGLKLNFAEMMSHGAPIGPELNTPVRQAAVVADGALVESQSVLAVIQGGHIDGSAAEGIYITSSEEDFGGIVVDGDKPFVIRNSNFDLEGNGHDDWLGKGTAVSTLGHSDVLIENCRFNFSGVTRCTIQAAENSCLTVRNSRFINIAPDGTDWVGDFSWQVGFRGHNRLTQLSDNADVRYENCVMHGNGWGLLSIDGTGDPKSREDDPEGKRYAVTMYVKDSDMTLSGPRSHGYGAFCIGDNHITFDHTRVDVFGYPILLMGMMGQGRFDVVNGCEITGRRFGAMIVDDDNSVLNIEDSAFDTGKSCICAKGSSTIVDVRNTTFRAGNGTILQLMDCDEGGMNKVDFRVPLNEKDVKDPQRDLTVVSAEDDFTVNLTDCEISGNFYNSTTNIRAYQFSMVGGMGKLHDLVLGVIPPPPADMPSPVQMRHNGNDLKGAMNLGVNLKNTRIEGIISAAEQAYAEGVLVITAENRDELSNVVQTAAAPVNNGVVVSIDAVSAWYVTGDSYITALSLEEGGILAAADGKTLRMTVDGKETAAAPGKYAGEIHLFVGE